MESLGELERLVATVVRVVKTVRTGKGVGTSCSRIDTDNLDVFHRRLRTWRGDSRKKERFSSHKSLGRRLGMTAVAQRNIECNSIPEQKPRKIGDVRSWPLP